MVRIASGAFGGQFPDYDDGDDDDIKLPQLTTVQLVYLAITCVSSMLISISNRFTPLPEGLEAVDLELAQLHDVLLEEVATEASKTFQSIVALLQAREQGYIGLDVQIRDLRSIWQAVLNLKDVIIRFRSTNNQVLAALHQGYQLIAILGQNSYSCRQGFRIILGAIRQHPEGREAIPTTLPIQLDRRNPESPDQVPEGDQGILEQLQGIVKFTRSICLGMDRVNRYIAEWSKNVDSF